MVFYGIRDEILDQDNTSKSCSFHTQQLGVFSFFQMTLVQETNRPHVWRCRNCKQFSKHTETVHIQERAGSFRYTLKTETKCAFKHARWFAWDCTHAEVSAVLWKWKYSILMRKKN